MDKPDNVVKKRRGLSRNSNGFTHPSRLQHEEEDPKNETTQKKRKRAPTAPNRVHPEEDEISTNPDLDPMDEEPEKNIDSSEDFSEAEEDKVHRHKKKLKKEHTSSDFILDTGDLEEHSSSDLDPMDEEPEKNIDSSKYFPKAEEDKVHRHKKKLKKEDTSSDFILDSGDSEEHSSQERDKKSSKKEKTKQIFSDVGYKGEEKSKHPYKQQPNKNLNWEADLTDPLVLKKMIGFTKSMHGPSNFYSHDIFIIKFKGKEVGRLQTYSEVKYDGKFVGWDPNYAYAYGPEVKNTEKALSYAEIGIILGHFKPEILIQMANLALILFRSRPINNEKFDALFNNPDFKVQQIDKNLQNKLNETAKSKQNKSGNNPEKKYDMKRLNNFINNPKLMFVQLIGAMACEAGRGHAGLEPFVATLHIIKYWKANKKLILAYGVPKEISNKPLNEAVSEDIFPDVYGGNDKEKKLTTRIAVGHLGSQEHIRINSGEVEKQKNKEDIDEKKNITESNYKEMLKRDRKFLGQLKSKDKDKDNKWDKPKFTPTARKLDRHASILFGAEHNTINRC